MNSFSVVILTKEGVAYDGLASSLYVPSSKGPLGLLPGYTPTISPLVDGVGKLINEEGRAFYFALRHGVVEVKPEKVYVLVSAATPFPSEEAAKESLHGVSVPPKGGDEVKKAEAALTGTYADYKQNSYNGK